MEHWRRTAALTRAIAVAGLALACGAALGDPVIVVLVAPIAVVAALGLRHRPREAPRVATRLAHRRLYEGQATTSTLELADAGDVEYVTRVSAQAPYLALHPTDGVVGSLVGDGRPLPVIEVSPRRWGRHLPGEERIGAMARWGGYLWGPVLSVGHGLQAWPAQAPFDSRAEVPQASGLVGAHRSRRLGAGSEFAGIRAFRPGDRLRRLNWRLSLRTGELHVVATHREADSGVLLVLDALAEVGWSGGVDGAASSTDIGVRAAAALAEHHLRQGDRVALRVVSRVPRTVPYGAGRRHHWRLLGALSEVVVGEERELEVADLRLRVGADTVVIVLSPMLHEATATLAHQLSARGVPLLVIDTLPPGATPDVRVGVRPRIVELAWRMRRQERELLLERLARGGCPVVPWRGPGTVDDVLRRLARRGRAPQVRRS